MTRTPEENAADSAYDEARLARLLPVYVVAQGDPSEREDQSVAGVYLVNVEPHLTEEQKAEAALDHFHDNVGIGCLDDFTIEVYDANGNLLPRMNDYDSGSLLAHAEYVDFVEGDKVPVAVRAAMTAGDASPMTP